MKVFTLYHRDADGRFAAYASWRHHLTSKPGVEHELIGVQYNEPFPLELGNIHPEDHIYIVDFSYDRKTLETVYSIVKDRGLLVVLDHHETAKAQLEGLPFVTFDMTKSGALLSWEHFYGENSDYGKIHGKAAPVPWTCKLVNDRDLWKWEFGERTRHFHAYLEATSLTDDWSRWNVLSMSADHLEEAIMEGEAIENYHKSIVDRHVRGKKAWHEIMFSWMDKDQVERKAPMRLYASMGMLVSELGQGHYTQDPNCFTLEYRVIGDEMIFSFRSPDSDNVCHVGFLAQAIAGVDADGKPKGGGHGCAAGMSMSLAKGLRVVSYLYANQKNSKTIAVTDESLKLLVQGN